MLFKFQKIMMLTPTCNDSMILFKLQNLSGVWKYLLDTRLISVAL